MQISDEGRRKQGRGTGNKETWKAWNLGSDFPGQGRKMKAPSHMFPPRHLQGQSKTEDDLLYMVEVADNIEDFKEQFNLPLEETKKIAAKLGIKHPISPDKRSEVMTLDCVIFYKTGKPKAIDVKYLQEDLWGSKKLRRDLEKLQIKKVWAEENGFEWLLFTHLNVPKILITNVRTLRESFKYEDEKIENYKEHFSKIDNSFNGSIGEVNEQISKALKIASSRGWKIISHLCAHKIIRFNLNIPFNKKTTFSSFHIV